MRFSVLLFALVLLAACGSSGPPAVEGALSLEDELGFRRLRQEYHVATTVGDSDFMRGLWADDAVLTTAGGDQLVGPDEITDHLAANPDFGKVLILTSESRWRVDVRGDTAEYGFESIAVELDRDDPTNKLLSEDGSQRAKIEIVAHTHSTGIAERGLDGRWIFKELRSEHGPLPLRGLAQEGIDEFGLPVEDELGFRRMREQFHLATITGDRDLMRTVWGDDAVFRGGPNEVFGGDAITDFMASNPNFGRVLVVTPEYSARLAVHDGIAEYAFECITIDVGDGDPLDTALCDANGTQNPDVEIIRHTNTSGFATRLEDGRWVFQEFNGALGPIAAE
jgi:hypothetical protein